MFHRSTIWVYCLLKLTFSNVLKSLRSKRLGFNETEIKYSLVVLYDVEESSARAALLNERLIETLREHWSEAVQFFDSRDLDLLEVRDKELDQRIEKRRRLEGLKPADLLPAKRPAIDRDSTQQ